jgi:hypothetical protein
MPDDELARAGEVVDHRRRVARLARREVLPDLLASVLVEGDDRRALAAYQANEPIAVDERMSGEAPERHFNLVFLEQILGPENVPLEVEAVELPHRAEGVDLVAGDDRRGARSGGVADVVGRLVFVLPQDLAGHLVQTQHAFLAVHTTAAEGALGVLGPLGEHAIGDEDSAVRDGGTGVALGDGRAPAHLGTAGGELGDEAGLAPDAVALGAEPLRPIVGRGGRREHQGGKEPTHGQTTKTHAQLLRDVDGKVVTIDAAGRKVIDMIGE